MGVFSTQSIQKQEEYYRPDFSYPSRLETLSWFLEDMNDRLSALEERHPYDPLRCQGDADEVNLHYYENPVTYSGLIRAITEVKDFIHALSPCSIEETIIMGVLPMAALPTVGTHE